MTDKGKLGLLITVVAGLLMAVLAGALLLGAFGGLSSGKGGWIFTVLEAPGQAGWSTVTLVLSIIFFSSAAVSVVVRRKENWAISNVLLSQILVAGALCVVGVVYLLGISGTK